MNEHLINGFLDELEKISLAKRKRHPYSESQRRWAWAAEERGQLPRGKAHAWSRRAEGEKLPARTGEGPRLKPPYR